MEEVLNGGSSANHHQWFPGGTGLSQRCCGMECRGASNDAEVYDRKSLKRGVGIGPVVIVELFLGFKSNFVAVIVDIVHSDVLDRGGVKRLKLRCYFELGWKLVEGNMIGKTRVCSR